MFTAQPVLILTRDICNVMMVLLRTIRKGGNVTCTIWAIAFERWKIRVKLVYFLVLSHEMARRKFAYFI